MEECIDTENMASIYNQNIIDIIGEPCILCMRI